MTRRKRSLGAWRRSRRAGLERERGIAIGERREVGQQVRLPADDAQQEPPQVFGVSLVDQDKDCVPPSFSSMAASAGEGGL
jgi:hypothetical protein